MLDIFLKWYYKKFSDKQFFWFFFVLVIGFFIIFFFHDILSPILISIVLAYLLEWPTQKLIQFKIKRVFAIVIVLLFFISISSIVILIIIPIVWQEGVNLLFDLPSMLSIFNKYIKELSNRYPILVDVGVLDILIVYLKNCFLNFSKNMVKYSLSSFIGIISFFVYLILIPLIVFFLLKDKNKIIKCFQKKVLKNNFFFWKFYKEINKEIRNYIYGKIIEIIIIGVLSYFIFIILGLHYSLFLSVCIGFSVLIPYIGSVMVTIPLILVAIFQWGINSQFWTLILTYSIIQIINGNLLVPILFSEVVNLHPLIIILSTIIFGKMYGFWGVFFAIPLTILIKTVINVFLEKNKVKEFI